MCLVVCPSVRSPARLCVCVCLFVCLCFVVVAVVVVAVVVVVVVVRADVDVAGVVGVVVGGGWLVVAGW